MAIGYPERPFVRLVGGPLGVICHGEDGPVRVVLKKDKISVGCTDTTIETLRYLVEKYEAAFPDHKKEVILQTGSL